MRWHSREGLAHEDQGSGDGLVVTVAESQRPMVDDVGTRRSLPAAARWLTGSAGHERSACSPCICRVCGERH